MLIDDFIQYWCAWQILLAGGNPYSPELLLPLQQTYIPTIVTPLMFWPGPWVLFFFLPSLLFSFYTAAIVWLIQSLILYTVSGLLIRKIYGTSSLATTLLILMSVPLYLNISMGQMGGILSLGVALVFWGTQSLAIVEACGWVLLASKPHLFIVFFAGRFFLQPTKSMRSGAIAAILLLGLLSLAYLFSSAAVTSWFNLAIFQQYPEGAIEPTKWMTSTLSKFIETTTDWNLKVPILVGGILGAYFLKGLEQRSGYTVLPELVALSLATANFGWTFDHVVLTYVLASRLSNDPRRTILFQLNSMVVVALSSLLWPTYQTTWWYAWVVLFYLLSTRPKASSAHMLASGQSTSPKLQTQLSKTYVKIDY